MNRSISKIDPFASRHDGVDSIGADLSTDIRSVTRSPYTVAAIAATATVVPVGSAIAGIATAGLAVAEGVAAIAKPFGAVIGAFSKRRNKRRKARDAKRRAAKKRLRDGEATGIISNMMVRARSGDEKARSEMVALAVLNDKSMLQAKAYAKALASGVPESEARRLATAEARIVGSEWSKVVNKARARALTLPNVSISNPHAGPAPNKQKIVAATREAARKLAAEARKHAQVRGALEGVFLPVASVKPKRGRFVNLLGKGLPGFVVTQSGRVVMGDFKGAK